MTSAVEGVLLFSDLEPMAKERTAMTDDPKTTWDDAPLSSPFSPVRPEAATWSLPRPEGSYGKATRPMEN